MEKVPTSYFVHAVGEIVHCGVHGGRSLACLNANSKVRERTERETILEDRQSSSLSRMGLFYVAWIHEE